MIYTEDLIEILKKNKISFYTGVPDSVLKELSNKIVGSNNFKHVMAVNEGNAVSIGIGHYLSTKKIPCIYMQNSGLGNAINPLASIAHENVYAIPLLLVIGWRGSPNKKDEPQHMTKGKITTKLLKLLNIDYCILKNKNDLYKLDMLINRSYKRKKIVACLLEKNILKNRIKKKANFINKKFPTRKEFLLSFLKEIKNNYKIVSTTGYTSRELMQIRKEKKLNKGKDFYMVGGMGHASAVASSFALNSTNPIVCLDGDGSILMHFGSLFINGKIGNANFKHILLNNNSHESVGGQETGAFNINFKKIVSGLGYKKYFKIYKKNRVSLILKKFLKSKGPSFLEVLISPGTFHNLIRPQNLIKIKNNFSKKK